MSIMFAVGAVMVALGVGLIVGRTASLLEKDQRIAELEKLTLFALMEHPDLPEGTRSDAEALVWLSETLQQEDGE